jgi:hypothetical protein
MLNVSGVRLYLSDVDVEDDLEDDPEEDYDPEILTDFQESLVYVNESLNNIQQMQSLGIFFNGLLAGLVFALILWGRVKNG